MAYRIAFVLLTLLPALVCAIPVKPLMMGNWADPTVTKLGDTYYLTSNTVTRR